MKNKIKEVPISSLIQQFGYLIVADPQMKIIGISEHVLTWSSDSVEKILGATLESFLPKIFKKKGVRFLNLIEQLSNREIPRQVLSKKINNKRYYFKFRVDNEHIYIEWEEQQKKFIPTVQMNELSFLFEPSYPHNWALLCNAVNKLLNFDRTFLLRIQEGGHSKVLAEYTEKSKANYLNREFSDIFFDTDTISFYNDEPYRYFPDLSKLDQKVYWYEDIFQLNHSHMACLPHLHEAYLKERTVGAVIFFPLLINDEFWGLLVAQNDRPKNIDLQKRKLCSFVIQNAMNKYGNIVKQGLLDFNQQILKVESILKDRLMTLETINCAVVQCMDPLREIVKAQGFAVYNHGDLFFSGNCPEESLLYELIDYLRNTTDKTIFKDNNFRLTHGANFTRKLPFAGIMTYTIGKEKDYYLIWFRKETVSKVTHVDMPAENKNNESFPLSLINHFRTWEKTTYDSAIPWDERDLNFIENLQRIINEAIINKTRERELVTENLLSVNNELEMFTFTLSHDLKNPLSILKMGLQFLQNSCSTLVLNERLRWYKNMLESALNIEDIINNVVVLSQSKMAVISKTPIPMSYTIRRISDEATLLYDSKNCQFHFGKLYPIWGEKSALYQIFLNLIGNAVKYSSSKETPQVWIESKKNTKEIEYIIKDNGIGIPSNILPHIFEMFARGTNAQQFEGTGIGLSLVKRIIDRLGGEIKIRSKEYEGTEISLTFPLISDFPSSMVTDTIISDVHVK